MPKTPLENLGDFVLAHRLELASGLTAARNQLAHQNEKREAEVIDAIQWKFFKLCNAAKLEPLPT